MDSMLFWLESHPNLASWVQAVGAIVALVIAIGLPAWQSYRLRSETKARDKQAILDQLRKLGAIADFALQKYQDYHDGLWNEPETFILDGFSRATVTGILTSLDAYPIFSLPNYFAVNTALRIRDACHRGGEQILTAARHIEREEGDGKFHLLCLEDVMGELSELLKVWAVADQAVEKNL